MNDEQLNTLTAKVVEAIEDKKAQDVIVLNVQGACAFADRFVVATGRTERQIKALAQAVAEIAHGYGIPAKVEGLEAAEWLLIDLGDIVVHLFLPDVRISFQLERLWKRPDEV